MNTATQQLAQEHIGVSRRALGLKESRKAEYWAALDAGRRAAILKLAKTYNGNSALFNRADWTSYTGEQQWAIEEALRKTAQRAFDDAFFMGAMRGVRRPEAE